MKQSTSPIKAKDLERHTIYRRPSAVKEEIIQYLFDYKDWYIDNLLREHAEEILKNSNSIGGYDECMVSDSDDYVTSLEDYTEKLYCAIMQDIINIIETEEETEELVLNEFK